MELSTNKLSGTSKNNIKVKYLGELRIVGLIVNDINSKEPIGYLIMTEKSKKFRGYTIEQTVNLLKRFKFVNAILNCSEVIITECSKQRLNKFDKNLTPLGKTGIMILGEIIENNKKVGYQALDCNGVIANLTEKALIDYSIHGDIINAKVVNSKGKKYISAIKGEFTKIEVTNNKENTNKQLKETEGSKTRKIQHALKIKNYLVTELLLKMYKSKNLIPKKLYTKYGDKKQGYNSIFDIDKETKIIFKEIITKQNKFDIDTEDKEILSDIIHNMPHNNKLGKPSKNDQLYMCAIGQFILTNGEIYTKNIVNIARKLTKYEIEHIDESLAAEFTESKFVIKEMKQFHRDLKYQLGVLNSKNKNRTSYKKSKAFNTTSFTTTNDIAQLGFAISEKDKGIKFETDSGYHKTLLYLGDIIPENMYKDIMQKSRCLGDILCIAYIEKINSKRTEGNNWYSRLSQEDYKQTLALLVTIAYMFNSQAMKTYVELNKDTFDKIGINIDYDNIAGINYKFSKEIIMYYESGFNVFLSDNEHYKYASEHLRNAKIINYRQLGVTHTIEHPSLVNEFASTILTVAPEIITDNFVVSNIGRLRFL